MGITGLDPWAEFGVAGIVIGALFCVIIVGFKMFMNFIQELGKDFKDMIKEIKKQHSEDLRRMYDQHAEERTRWGVEADKRDQRYGESMKEFSQAVRDLGQIINQFNR